ncbi:RNA-binding S4 domain-containing protein [Paraglaciecola sp. L3A3]|uniref:RNA-binding S4 domain-containing protein n=1 Tax=Paraglaciecola sp. L3A3 TaxID=2686358 RepID=UPI00131B605A|nr:RNA-binding S4 domain-containing protein [Paraglaciecola sp. L3A3]
MHTIELTKAPAELAKVLKFEGIVESGGQAKLAITAGQVLVNGEVETRKGRKINNGDTITFGAETWLVECVGEVE